MCSKCEGKALELDNKVPHFIDRMHGIYEMPDSVFVPARKELWDYMISIHGRTLPV